MFTIQKKFNNLEHLKGVTFWIAVDQSPRVVRVKYAVPTSL